METSLDYVFTTYKEIRPLIQKILDDTEAAIRSYSKRRTQKSESELERLSTKYKDIERFLLAMDSVADSPTKIPRTDVLQGATYIIHPATIDEAVYITINSQRIGPQLRPVEVFVNSKNMENFQWISALTRMISSVFRQPGPFPAFVINELKQTHDPLGGYFVGKWRCPSIVAHIGLVIEDHCKQHGLIKGETNDE